MLKPDERNKFFRDARWNLDIETNEDTCQKCCEAQGEGLGPNECRKLLKGTGRGEFRYWDKMHARRCWKKGGNKHVDIEARWPQKIGEREAGGRGKVRHRKQDERKKLLRRGSLDIETAWVQEVAERHRWGKFSILKQDACKKFWRGDRGTRYEAKWMQEVAKSTG